MVGLGLPSRLQVAIVVSLDEIDEASLFLFD